MKTNNVVLLALAMSTVLFATACDRDAATDATTTTPAAVEPTPVPAEPVPAPVPEPATDLSFAELDKNSDGGIAMDELSDSDMLHQHFTTADADGDGKLSSAEVDKHRADMAAAPAK